MHSTLSETADSWRTPSRQKEEYQIIANNMDNVTLIKYFQVL